MGRIKDITKQTRSVNLFNIGSGVSSWEFHVEESGNRYDLSFKFSSNSQKTVVNLYRQEGAGWTSIFHIDNSTNKLTNIRNWKPVNDTWFVVVSYELNGKLHSATADSINYPTHGNELTLYWIIPTTNEKIELYIHWVGQN